jgi:hypothetical protein
MYDTGNMNLSNYMDFDSGKKNIECIVLASLLKIIFETEVKTLITNSGKKFY